MTTYGEILKQARVDAGYSQDEATFRSRQYLPESLWFSTGTLQRFENGTTPEQKANPVVLRALAKLYGVPLRQVSVLADESLSEVRTLLDSSSPWIPALADHPSLFDFAAA